MIELINLTKTYGELKAVNEMNLVIEKGEFFGLLGPNGAGKTTLIRMLSTLTPPTSGNIMINGVYLDRDKTRIKSKIGIVPQHTNLEPELTARQNLELHGRLFNMSGSEASKRADELLKFTDLTDRQNDISSKLSGGMKRKLMIARALFHYPDVLLLDEPTVGLDPMARRKLWDLMKGLNKNGMTVILTTHYIEEAEILCSRIGLINDGKIAALDSPKNLIKQVGEFVLEVFDKACGETKYYFFPDRISALEAAKDYDAGVNIRPSNLEDTFLMLTDRKVGA